MTVPQTLSADSEWSSLEGVILDGGYELKNAIAPTDTDAAFRVRVLGGAGLEATAQFYLTPAPDAERQLMLWQLLRELPHRNITTPFAAGRRIVNGNETAYVVLGIPDDKLSGIAGERPLSEAEAREVIRSAARALGHLHANGLAHGCISASTVLANGDSIQLAGECVRRLNEQPPVEVIKPHYVAPESEGSNVTAAADVWCLGAALFEALAQKPYHLEVRKEAAALPFGVLLRRCLMNDASRRATLSEVLAILEKGPSAALDLPEEDEIPAMRDTTEQVPKETSRAAAAGAGWGDVFDIPVIRAPKPPQEVTLEAVEEKVAPPSATTYPEHPVRLASPVPLIARHSPLRPGRQPVEARILLPDRTPEEEARLALVKFIAPTREHRSGIRLKMGPGTWRGLLGGAVALLMVAGVIWQVILPKLQTRIENAERAVAVGQAENPAWLTRTLPAGDTSAADARRKPLAEQSAAKASSAATVNAPTSTWRVVLYAYEHQEDAARRVELVNHNHPGLRAHLFVAGNGGPYFVVTGDATTEDHAVALRKRALQLGVPHAQVQEFRE